MLWFRKKQGEVEKGNISPKQLKSIMESVRAGLNSQWFQGPKSSILKEMEITETKKGIVDDKTRDRAIASTLSSLDSAIEAVSTTEDQEGLREAAELALLAYTRIGKPALLDTFMDTCKKAGMTEDEIKNKLISTGDSSRQIDITVNLYAKAGDKKRLLVAGNKALDLYMEEKGMDIISRGKLFEYVVKAYKTADAREALIQAGEKALKDQIESRHFSHEKDWVLDAQKAYEAADDKGGLEKIGDQYVNLYLKEGLEIWLDKGVAVYKESETDYADKLGKLADRIEEKGHPEMADIIKQKIVNSKQ